MKGAFWFCDGGARFWDWRDEGWYGIKFGTDDVMRAKLNVVAEVEREVM